MQTDTNKLLLLLLLMTFFSKQSRNYVKYKFQSLTFAENFYTQTKSILI